MPEMHFRVEWPDGKQEEYYSPSLVIKEYFSEDTEYSVEEFLKKARTALTIASNRVLAKYGFACGRAMGSLQRIQQAADLYKVDSGSVRVVHFVDGK